MNKHTYTYAVPKDALTYPYHLPTYVSAKQGYYKTKSNKTNINKGDLKAIR